MHGFRQEQERSIYAQRTAAEARRGSSISTVTIDRDYDMVEDHTAHSDEDGGGCRRSSNYRLVCFPKNVPSWQRVGCICIYHHGT